VTHLWVSAAVRGAGHGTSLMREAEGYARDRGAIGITLETFSFQARSFYERLGRGAQGGNHTQSPTRRTAVFPQYGGVSARHIGGGALIPTSQEPNFPIGAA
jgi:predicted N-acetyltransferase YhbS